MQFGKILGLFIIECLWVDSTADAHRNECAKVGLSRAHIYMSMRSKVRKYALKCSLLVDCKVYRNGRPLRTYFSN